MTADDRYELPADTVIQAGDGEALLVKLNAEEMFALNDTGAAIVQALSEGGTMRAVIDQLAARYQAERAAVERDVDALVAELVMRGLLVRRDEGRSAQ